MQLKRFMQYTAVITTVSFVLRNSQSLTTIKCAFNWRLAPVHCNGVDGACIRTMIMDDWIVQTDHTRDA